MSSLDRITALADEMKKKKKKQTGSSAIDRITTLADQLKAGDENAITNYMSEIDNTIAPIKTTIGNKEEEEKWYQKILKGSEAFDDNLRRFEDGWDFGDITKTGLETIWDTGTTAVSTVADIGTNIGKGAVKVGEGAGKLIGTGVAQVHDWAGNEEKADLIRGRIAGTVPNAFGTYGAPLSQEIDKVQEKYIDPNSVSGHYADMVAESIGYSGTIAAVGSVAPALAMPTVFASSSGHAAEEVYKKDDVSGLEAWAKILGTGTIETVAESMFGLMGVGGTNFTNKLTNEALERATSKAGKILTRLGIAGLGESAEEFLSYAGNHLYDNYIVDKLGDADFSSEWDNKEVAEQMAIAFVSAGISQGAMTSSQVNVAIKETEEQLGRKLTDKEKASLTQGMLNEGNTKNEQQVLDKLVEREVAAKEKDGTKVTRRDKNKIIKELQEDLQKGLIDTADIESMFGGEAYTRLQEAKARAENIQKEIDVLDNMKNAEITVKEMKRLNSLEQRLKEIDIRALQTEVDNEIFNKIGENNNFLQRSYYERSQKGKKFEYEITEETSEIRKKAYITAEKSKANNSTKTRNYIENMVKIGEDTGTNIIFVNNEQIKRHYDKTGAKMVDGYVNNKGELVLNIDSPKALNKTVGHEVAHLFEGTKEGDVYRKVLKAYAELKGDYQAKKSSMAEIYKNVNANLENEVIADLTGDYLFSNDLDFINHLSAKEPNVFKKVYNYIKHLAKQLTAGTKEKRQLEKVKYRFEQAYRSVQKTEQNNTELNRTEQNTKYSMSEDSKEGRLKHLNEEFELYSKTRDEAYDLRDEAQKKYDDFIKTDEYKNALSYVTKNLDKQDTEEFKSQYAVLVQAQKWQDEAKQYQADVDAAYKEMTRLSEQITNEEKAARNPKKAVNQAKKEFGITNNFKEAGYLLQDGTLLDFSGRNQGSGAVGRRTLDHRDINVVGYDMDEFIALGNIRMQPESNGFELMSEPTAKQYSALKKYIDNADGEIFIDIYKDGRMASYDSTEYKKGTPTSKIISDLQYYFKNGKFPQKSELAEFRYSLTDNQGRELSEGQQEYFKDSKARDEEGNLVTVYHGTNTAGFMEFKKAYNYFSSSRKIGESYTRDTQAVDTSKDIEPKTYSGVYEGYVNITNPLIIDAHGERWSGIPLEYIGIENIKEVFRKVGSSYFRERGKLRTSTTDIVIAIAKSENFNYDGIIFKNIIDQGLYFHEEVDDSVSDVYVTFSSEQFKAHDNKNPTKNRDIRYSLSDSEGNELNPIVQKRFERSKARDENGKLKVLYHGTPFGEFAVFDKAKANIENDFGKGFYFTDSETDVESNYEGGGADFETKVSRLAELIELDEDISYEEAREKARKQLYKGDHKFEVYVNIENPAIVGETILFDRDSYAENYNMEDFDSEEEYYDEIDQLVRDDIESVMWQIRQELEFFVEDDGIENVLFEAYIEGGIGVQELKDRINELYLETEEGIAGNEITRIIIEALGYDGIIDPTVSTKWDKMNMDEGTTHYIVFKRNQIKAITNENPTDHDNIHLSLSDSNNIEPRQRGLTYSEDVKIQDVIGDIEKTIDDLFDRINKIYARVTVDAEDYAPVNEANLSDLEKQYEENFKTINDDIAPVVQELDQVDEENTLDSKGITLDDKVLRDEMLGLGVAKKHNSKELKQSAEELNALISEGKTDDEALNTFVDGLGDRLLIEHDPYEYDDAVKGARDYIRTTRLYVSDEVKNGIGQWNEFRKANMGKMKLTNDPKATPVDSAYQELQGLYGTTLFPDDIYNPADQLELISDLLGASKGILPIREYLESQYGTRAWDEMKESFINRIKAKITEAAKLKEATDYTDYHASIPIDDSYIPEVSKRQDIDDIAPMRNEVPEFEDVATQRRMDFDNQVITDDPVSDLEKKKARALKKLGSKENFIKDKVTDFYNETKKLTKGVRASYDLSRVLDVAFKDIEKITEGMSEEDAKAERNRVWRDVTNSFMNIKAKPFETVNPNSKVEAMIRQEIDRQYNAKLQGIDDMKEVKPKKAVQEEQRELARKLIGDTSTWVDKSMGIKYRVNTLKRNLRDIIKDVNGNPDIKRADAIYEEYEGKYNKNEAKLKVEFNRLAQPFRDLKLTRAEEVYVQMLGELRHNPDTSLLPDKVEEFYEANKDKIDTGKVEIAIDNARDTYDELFNRINQTLRNQGMKELEYRKGYFPHFVEEKQGLLAKLFDWKIRNEQIPTDIAGLTELNNPERSWQSFNKHREGDTTDYNFSKGFDTYVRGALDWIYHIEDIQKRRALENEIRYQHSAKGVKEKIDAIYNNTELDADEKQAQIEAVFGVARTPLNNFVTDLRTGTNILAGKKSSLDRSMEYNTNRQIYSTMTNISNRVSGNMIVGSLSSALTNFIPITQSWLQVSPLSSLNATKEVIANAIKDDGTIAKSTFLTNRMIRAENLYKSNWDKASEKVAIMTDVIDSITSQVVWRAKYNENIKNGMSEIEAINNADIFAENVIAGRSRGNEPTIFHSKNPLTKMFTAFQLEVNNQYGYMFKDAPIDIDSKNKLIKGYATAFIGAFIYNALYSSLTGRDAAFDPIGLIADILKELGFGGDDEEEEKSAAEKFTAITEDLVQQLPFVGGLFGGGRVPLSAAIPYENPIEMVKGTGADLLNLTDGEKREKAFKDLTSEWLKPVTYLALPFGGGQISKTVKGLSMYDEDLPVAGSYTNGGDLRFTADESTTGKIKSAIFGQWASKSAQEYVDSGFQLIKKKNIDELVDLGMTSTEYRKYRKGLKDAGTTNEEKIEYINSLDVPISHKNIMTNNVLKRDYEVDMTGFTNYDEFDFSYKNPEKYDFLQANNISYEEYTTSKERKEAYNWAYENPESYAVSKAVTDDIVLYRQYKKDLDKLTADKNSEGKSISGSAKNKKLDYINNLDIDYGARIILYKTEYPSADEYNNDIINYLNERDDISSEEMTIILKKLGMEVDSQGNISW